jgi:4-hydroxyphenylpyruvate dioxygenase-like putative hemolysin
MPKTVKEVSMAKILGINHIAFVVKNLDESIQTAVETMGGKVTIKFESMTSKYIGAVIQYGNSFISLLQATDESSFVAKHLEKYGPSPQHMGLVIDDLDEYVAQLEAKGIRVDKSDMKDEKFKEALVGPKTGNGVVLQLMQWKDGPMDTTPEGIAQLKRKYTETPGLRLIE